MFTTEQIKTAHAKVRSGADFPAYIKDLKQLGITSYETFVHDGHTDYFGNDNSHITSPSRYDDIIIAGKCDPVQFEAALKTHQQGNTDYMTFCNDCARSGIEKWTVPIEEMTCTYYDKTGNEVLVEGIAG